MTWKNLIVLAALMLPGIATGQHGETQNDDGTIWVQFVLPDAEPGLLWMGDPGSIYLAAQNEDGERFKDAWSVCAQQPRANLFGGNSMTQRWFTLFPKAMQVDGKSLYVDVSNCPDMPQLGMWLKPGRHAFAGFTVQDRHNSGTYTVKPFKITVAKGTAAQLLTITPLLNKKTGAYGHRRYCLDANLKEGSGGCVTGKDDQEWHMLVPGTYTIALQPHQSQAPARACEFEWGGSCTSDDQALFMTTAPATQCENQKLRVSCVRAKGSQDVASFKTKVVGQFGEPVDFCVGTDCKRQVVGDTVKVMALTTYRLMGVKPTNRNLGTSKILIMPKPGQGF